MNGPCPDMQERIADYVLGALDERQTEGLRRHLADCPDCRGYLESLQRQGALLVGLGRELEGEMETRQDNVIRALEEVATPAGVYAAPVWLGRLARLAVAAVLILTAGIVIGRLTAPAPVDVDQLRADVETSVLTSLRPTVEQGLLAEVDRRLATALAASDDRIKTQIVDQLRRDLRVFGARFLAESQAQMDVRLDEVVRLIEAARLADRQRVARAFEQVEQNRLRDRAQIGRGFQTLAVLTDEVSSPVPAPAAPTNN